MAENAFQLSSFGIVIRMYIIISENNDYMFYHF